MKSIKKVSKVAILLAVTIFAMCFAGCGKSEEAKPEESVKSFFSLIQKKELDKASKYTKDESMKFKDKEQTELAETIFSKVKCDVISSTKKEDTATVKANITSVDFLQITKNMVKDLMPKIIKESVSGKLTSEQSDKMMQDYFVKQIKDPKVKMIKKETDIKLVKGKEKDDPAWVIDVDDKLMNAMSGGLQEAVKSLQSQMAK